MKLAFLDFDGTLSKGYISMEFMEYLKEKGAYSEAAYKSQMEILEKYKNCKLTYDNWCAQWGELWSKGLEGRKTEEISKMAREFYKTFSKNVYDSSYKISELLKEKNYCPIIISVGSKDVIQLAAKDLGIDKVYASELEEKDGVYTGKLKTVIHKPEGKQKVLRELANRYTMKGSLAFGDSIADAKMLELVELPIALNPSPELREVAEKEGWKTLTNKNVLEELRKLIYL